MRIQLVTVSCEDFHGIFFRFWKANPALLERVRLTHCHPTQRTMIFFVLHTIILKTPYHSMDSNNSSGSCRRWQGYEEERGEGTFRLSKMWPQRWRCDTCHTLSSCLCKIHLERSAFCSPSMNYQEENIAQVSKYNHCRPSNVAIGPPCPLSKRRLISYMMSFCTKQDWVGKFLAGVVWMRKIYLYRDR